MVLWMSCEVNDYLHQGEGSQAHMALTVTELCRKQEHGRGKSAPENINTSPI